MVCVCAPRTTVSAIRGIALKKIMNKVQKRDGSLSDFDAAKIEAAIIQAVLRDHHGNYRQGRTLSASQRAVTDLVTQTVVATLNSRVTDGVIHIEDIQDQVELVLMRAGEHVVARDYVLYREARAADRRRPVDEVDGVDTDSGRVLFYDIRTEIYCAVAHLPVRTSLSDAIFSETRKSLYDGMPKSEIITAAIMAARSLIELDPDYSRAAAALLMTKIRGEAMGACLGYSVGYPYQDYFPAYIARGIAVGRLDPRLAEFDLAHLGSVIIRPERDLDIDYLGLQILYDRYLIHDREVRIETPQAMWMRVAMGIALAEDSNRTEWAAKFYEVLSTFAFVSSTPTLFNAGTCHPQLSSCFLTTVPDDLEGIYDAIKENALLSKFSGGLGNDWTPVRSMGAYIKGTNGKSQGVVPFLKVVNDTAVAVNQGGKRKGAVCAYLETWHMDIEEFLELRKNTGDDRRRTHDMNTANWVPDLFMRRVSANQDWTLFSPSDVHDLHDLYGADFDVRYAEYEVLAAQGGIVSKTVSAVQLWRKMLTMLFETGHPWITFKDACNLRNPQQHAGVVHSSNLCTEITLNTSEEETAVCNLGSINLMAHVKEKPFSSALFEDVAVSRETFMLDTIDMEHLECTVRVAMRMLDNVISVNWYATEKGRLSNARHRPVGLGVMGVADALAALRIPYGSRAAVLFSDVSQEALSWFAIDASADLATQRGSYESFSGSFWSQGILPMDSIALRGMGGGIVMDTAASANLDWDGLREKVKSGMRNSNCLAIAPTATISNISGVSQGVDPFYQNLYAKSNLSGEFTVLNPAMVRDMKELGIWDAVMVNDLKYFDGSLGSIDRAPKFLRRLYATAFEIGSDANGDNWLVQCAARRQKWVDQAISLNLYMAEPSGPKIDALYRQCWSSGLKTTYYLRTLGATSAEKSTVSGGQLNAVSLSPASKVCSMETGCESCQ